MHFSVTAFTWFLKEPKTFYLYQFPSFFHFFSLYMLFSHGNSHGGFNKSSYHASAKQENAKDDFVGIQATYIKTNFQQQDTCTSAVARRCSTEGMTSACEGMFNFRKILNIGHPKIEWKKSKYTIPIVPSAHDIQYEVNQLKDDQIMLNIGLG